MSLQEPTKKVPKHLIDPATLQPGAARSRPGREERKRDLEKLARVKQWVSSALIVTTMFHLSVGLTIAAIFMDSDRTQARVGLNVIAVILMVSGAVGARVIHKKHPVSPWLLLALVPGVVGFWLTFR